MELVADLAVPAVPTVPVPHTHTVRPYSPADCPQVYEVCRRTCDDGADGTDIFPFHKDLVADKLIGAFLAQSPEYCFVIEDAAGVCGYVLGALDHHAHNQQLEAVWMPAMMDKYPCVTPSGQTQDADLTPAEEMIVGVHGHKSYGCEWLQQSYPSLVRVDMLPGRCNDATARHALAAATAALKTNGSHGVCAEIHVGDRLTVERYMSLGMKEVTAVPVNVAAEPSPTLPPAAPIPEDMVVVARLV